MFNNRQTDIIERNSYLDEFEKVNTAKENDYLTSEKNAFNSKIADNFDRIMHYDTYNRQAEIEERNNLYTKFSKGVNTDAMPSNTTMQFRGLQKESIYEDYRVEEVSYASSTSERTRTKLLLCFMAVILTVLSALIVLNTTLLNNMNALIREKSSQVSLLEEQSKNVNLEYENILKDNNILN